MPAAIAPVRGTPEAEAVTGEVVTGEVAVDAVHEAHARFTDLRPGDVCGLRWTPDR
ncbi:hypothetical protein ACIGNX_22780 [Actinosynnema sp. NPDC053489]|uniref:hypothetical protein n=1 Tax=Actinosynnema sp. NPDC053489 TaxID=3363916 RepID=UPI0037C598D4